jgi:hypothetical protein
MEAEQQQFRLFVRRASRWKRCGARGVAVAPCWRSDFPAFLRDMGERSADAVLTKTDPGGW